MKKIIKSYKYRIYPIKHQEILFAKHFGSNRFVYNYFLNERKKRYLKDKTNFGYNDNSKELTLLKKENNYDWLKEINSQSLQSTLRHLDFAYKNFFMKRSKFPKFKSKSNKQSFKIPQHTTIKNKMLYFPKFNEGIKINLPQEIEGRIITTTISKSPTGKYYASITCEVDYKPYKKTGSKVGIDTGIKNLAILSDGDIYENIRVLKNKIKKLKYKSKQLSKKKKGSNSRDKYIKELSILYEKITNIRKDYLHKVTTEIVKNHDTISVEDLAVKNIMKNHKLAQAMSDVSLGIFYTFLEYKCEWNEKEYVKIDRWFPSSKTCSKCGWIKQDLTLKDRKWKCDSCGEEHDRDINAAKNILTQGINILSGCGLQSDKKQKEVEALSLDKS